MKVYILAILLAVVCISSAQFPAGWNYNPYLYFPYSALQPPAQETAEVAAARAAHMAAHAAVARRARSVEDTPEVKAATIEHYRAYNEAALANGVFAFLPARYANMPWAMPQPVQETAEVAAARRAHLAAHALARGKRSVEDTPEVRAATIEHYRAYNEAALANGVFAFLPARYANMPWAMPQPVQETPEVAAARRAHLAAHALAAARG
ncbi:cuticle protein 18.7-like [Daphnia carinata]|uniref:cuticle protein 18.7-like n=1 Tax=Daphnia carinata TaxID=120202 RepID=UPI00257EEFAE|nr:cuticle protein 18.7-like [Daphnia carinata]